jgi:hypothetical protein
MQIANRYAPWKIANGAENFVLQALQFHFFSAMLRFSLYSIWADLTENTTFNSSFIVVGAFTDPFPRNDRLLIRLLHSNGYVTILIYLYFSSTYCHYVKHYMRLYLQGYNAVYSVEGQGTFRRNMSPPSSESENKPSKKSA